MVRMEYRHPMQIVTTAATVKLILTMLTLTLLAPAGVRGPKGGRKEFPDPESLRTPLIPVVGATRIE
jgi:hypothetical protein